MNKEFAISLGGSVMITGRSINTEYLKEFAKLLFNHVDRAAIVTGGGPLSRMKQESLRKQGVTNTETLDQAGIPPTHKNAKRLVEILHENGLSASYVPDVQTKRPDVSILVTGGTKPRQTTDAVAIEWARILGYSQVINITNVPYVYEFSADRTLDMTKPISNMTYDDYLTLVGRKHKPGENIPAGRKGIIKAKKYGITFTVVGPDINNLSAVFDGKPFQGTIIHL